MTDAHTPRLLRDADAAADLARVARPVSLPGVTSEDALRLANEIEPLTRKCRPDNLTQGVAAMAIRTLVSERDAIAARMAELESEVLDQCRLNGMGAERELALMGRVRELEAERDAITELNHAQWLALGNASLLVAACNRLSGEAEEFDFDDGLGRGAPQSYWDEFEDALEQAAEAIDVANKTIH